MTTFVSSLARAALSVCSLAWLGFRQAWREGENLYRTHLPLMLLLLLLLRLGTATSDTRQGERDRNKWITPCRYSQSSNTGTVLCWTILYRSCAGFTQFQAARMRVQSNQQQRSIAFQFRERFLNPTHPKTKSGHQDSISQKTQLSRDASCRSRARSHTHTSEPQLQPHHTRYCTFLTVCCNAMARIQK